MQDKINAFWEITKKELEDKKAEMRNQDRQTEEAEDMHQRELKVSRPVRPADGAQQADAAGTACAMAWHGNPTCILYKHMSY